MGFHLGVASDRRQGQDDETSVEEVRFCAVSGSLTDRRVHDRKTQAGMQAPVSCAATVDEGESRQGERSSSFIALLRKAGRTGT